MQPDELAELLRRAIREGILSPGQPLVQEDLAKRFKVSRIPVREALRMLVTEGLATARSGRGLSVAKLDAPEVAELYDLRLTIEPALSPYIIANASPADLRRWRGLIREMDGQPLPLDEWVRANYQFHLALYAVTGRSHTLRVLQSLFNLTMPYSRLYMRTAQAQEGADREHEVMLDLIEHGDSAGLTRQIFMHLSAARDALVAYLETHKDEDAILLLQD
jgi:DNA-binding GntR family transcriptional regulator